MSKEGATDRIELPRSGQLPLRIIAAPIATSSSQTASATRWTEMTLYRTGDDRYVVAITGRSVHEGEVDRYMVAVCETPAEVIDAVRRKGRFTTVALDFLEQASSIDSEIADAAAEDLEKP